MWVIQGKRLVRLPDDAPVPPGSRTVEPPNGFEVHPENFEVKGHRVMARPRAKGEKKERMQGLKLTQDEIARVKKAIKEGRL
jgi:hypothetical protein